MRRATGSSRAPFAVRSHRYGGPAALTITARPSDPGAALPQHSPERRLLVDADPELTAEVLREHERLTFVVPAEVEEPQGSPVHRPVAVG